MIFNPTELAGVFVVDIKSFDDDRGLFARSFCAQEFEKHGLDPAVLQCNLSFNHKAGTIRGMHWQDETAPEPKFVRCIRGAIWDCVIDLRSGSETYGRHFGVELTADNRRALVVPALCAHGYQTLADNSEVLYQVGAFYTPAAERGLRYDDPTFQIAWPDDVRVVSEKDRNWPLYHLESDA